MFDFVRTHQRLMQFILLLFIFPSFAFFGLESYTRFQQGDNAVAKVAGQSITQAEFDEAQRRQTEQYRQMLGGQFDPKLFDTPQQRKTILDGLIAQRALAAEAARNNLLASDQALQQAILGMEGLTAADGKFDHDRYKSLLAMQGMTPVMFETSLRRDLAVQQVNAAVQSTAFVPKSVAARISDFSQQQREVQLLLFKAGDYVSQVKVSDQQLQDFYTKNVAQFAIPEQATIEYVVLNAATIEARIQVSDDDVKAYYEQNKQRYSVQEQRRASHILVGMKKDGADKEAARAKAEKLLAQLRQTPGDFAKLAKENSDDPGSGEKGGDLGFFGPGAMVKPFEEAANKLKQGEISGLVQTDFGFHIIQLTGIKPGSVKPLDEVKAEIAADIKKQQFAKKYAELAEVFTDTVYEQADSLKPVADKLKLKIETAANLTRQPNPAAAPNVPFNNQKFLAVLFSDDVVKNKRNTEAVEVAPNTLIAGRVVEHKPASKRPLEEVKAGIRERVIQEEAAKLARQTGEAKLAALKAKDDGAVFGAAQVVSRSKREGIEGVALEAVMKADVTKLPAYAGVEVPQQGYAVYRITKVTQPAAADAARRQAEEQQIAGIVAQQEAAAYVEALKQKAKVKLLKPVDQAKAPAEQ
ncbi:SurA N-terminal domain-containing protein [Janthinobacterium sp. 17J80-10]|uniref:SurA N-terminal domain-containing protein n=1 Tax=Janthinobacterium sp. 17J80-10 TaxID=2497863 RepID=UPI0010055151|nr:SurA N-terminal domain-containing protein [Janthinobacterium sp. 17J80-10]QAU34412.1 peptidylprolyl isomerase [Janthinobacterium sp. 17J80-10]